MITEELFFSEMIKLGSSMGQTFKKESQVIWYQDIIESSLSKEAFMESMKLIRQDSQYVSGNIANIILSTARQLPEPELPRLEMSGDELKESLRVSEICLRAYEKATATDDMNHIIIAMDKLNKENVLDQQGQKMLREFKRANA